MWSDKRRKEESQSEILVIVCWSPHASL